MTAALRTAVAESSPDRLILVEGLFRAAARHAYGDGDLASLLWQAVADEVADPCAGIRTRLVAAVAMADERVDRVVGEIIDTAGDHADDPLLLACAFELAGAAYLQRRMAGRFRDELSACDTPPEDWS